jgi:hypothetical protein
MSDEPPRRRRGRPVGTGFVPNRETRWLVQVLHAHGIPHKTIAANIDTDNDGIADGVSVKTLRKVFRKELDGAVLQLKAAMIAAVVKNALGGNFGAQKYWLSLYGGPEWKLTQGIDGEMPNTGATTIIIEGGLPPMAYRSAEADADDENETPAPTNGKGNGHAGNGQTSGH